MSNEYDPENDGWNSDEFHEVARYIKDLNSLMYEIDNCVHTCDPDDMWMHLDAAAEGLKEAIAGLDAKRMAL